MIDVLVYLRELPAAEAAETGFEPGEPELGRGIFTSRCETCHGFRPSLPGRIDLLERASPMTMTGYAAAMWNHAPRMAADSDGDLARIEEGGMRHLISYLFAQRYFSGNGDPAAGERVYQDKGCATCHENAGQEAGAPELSTSPEVYSPVTMTGALWRHGPSMLEALEERGMDWPVFEGSEMSDLIAYLNSRLVVRIAAGE
jgi:mono/diheme cytochrome c family protein